MTGAELSRWSEIRRAYSETDEPVSALCKRFGISTGAFYRHARREKWPKRTRPKEAADRVIQTASIKPDELVTRLYETLRQQMIAIEKRLKTMPDLDANNATATAERDARTLSTLVRTLEKLIELQGNVSKGVEDTNGTGTELDAERFRIELVRRIEEFGN